MTRDQPRDPPVAARSMAIIVIIAVAISSAIVGAAVDRMSVRPRASAPALPDTGFHPLSSILRSPTDNERRAIRAKLATELGLSTDQAGVVDSILDAHATEFRQLREEIRPRVEHLTSAVRADVERVLTPTQRLKYHQLLGDPRGAGHDSSSMPR